MFVATQWTEIYFHLYSLLLLCIRKHMLIKKFYNNACRSAWPVSQHSFAREDQCIRSHYLHVRVGLYACMCMYLLVCSYRHWKPSKLFKNNSTISENVVRRNWFSLRSAVSSITGGQCCRLFVMHNYFLVIMSVYYWYRILQHCRGASYYRVWPFHAKLKKQNFKLGKLRFDMWRINAV